MFPNLIELSLVGCPPTLLRGLYTIRSKLKVFKVQKAGVSDLESIFSNESKAYFKKFPPMILPSFPTISIPKENLFLQLTIIRLSHCGISKIDAAFHLFPNLLYLDLSHNQINHITHLQDCTNLSYLNLSYNQIEVLSNVNRVIGNIKLLNLSHNKIESLHGIDHLVAIETLDLSYNRISDYFEIQSLQNLPNLIAIVLQGNPISARKKYRLRVFQCLFGSSLGYSLSVPPPLVSVTATLDGTAITTDDINAIRFIYIYTYSIFCMVITLSFELGRKPPVISRNL